MIEWWGLVIDKYYAASEGGGSYVTAEEWLTKRKLRDPYWEGRSTVI